MGLYFVPWFALWERVLKALGWNNSIGSQESFPHTGYQACKADSHSDVSSCDTFPILIMWQILILVTQVWGEGHALLSQVLKKQQFMHSHLFWIVIVKFNVGFTRVWDWDENAYFHTWWWAPWPFDFKLFCSLWERTHIAWNQWYCKHMLSSMSFCWWTQQNQRKTVIFSTLTTTSTIFFQTDMDHMCRYMEPDVPQT